MDVARFLSELREEREQVEQEILSLEQRNRRGAGAHSVTEIRRAREAGGVTAQEPRKTQRHCSVRSTLQEPESY